MNNKIIKYIFYINVIKNLIIFFRKMESHQIRIIDSLDKKRYNLTHLNLITTIKDFLLERNYEINIEKGLNTIIYGITATIIKNGESSIYFIYQIEPDQEDLTLVSIDDTIEIIRLTDIFGISFDSKNVNIDLFMENNPDYKILSNAICHIVFNKISYDFLFKKEEELYLFLSGIIGLFENYIFIDDPSMKKRINKIWNYYDSDYDNHWDIDDFTNFCNELNLGMSSKEINSDFTNLDKDKSGFIEKKEFRNYILNYMKDYYIEEIFNKYNIDPNNPEEHLKKISPLNLLKFFKEEQKEEITLNELYEIILQFKSKIPEEKKENILKDIYSNNINKGYLNEELSINFKELFLILHSNITNILNFIEINKRQNEKRPLNDYFINSTHNTYLTGDQIKSNSTSEMYGFSVLEGYRLVELDCYNGDDDNIIITHGYTFCGEINLIDILLQLKKFGFVNSDYPIILSIENHLDEHHQKIMSKLFQEILIDLYIIDQNNTPNYYPTLEQLKRKFIIKCSGHRIIKENNNKIKRSEIKYDDNTSYMKDVRIRKINNIQMEQAMKEFIHKIHLNSKKKRIYKSRKKNINYKEEEDEIVEEESIEDLDKIRGIFGTKFHIDNIEELNYQPWEMVTLKSSKLIKYIDEPKSREKIIKFNINSFTKSYPESFASANYNLPKIWISGTQVAAINIQNNNDDYTLLNKIFFMNNRNSGYVLKPKKLLPESLIIEKYDKPKLYIVLRLISMVCIQKLVKKEGIQFGKNKLILEGFIIGSKNDMEKNKKFNWNFDGNLLQQSFNFNENMVFDIYESDLSFIYLKLFYDSELIGRSVIPVNIMKEGYRKIPLYDINCIECKESYLTAKITKNYNTIINNNN